MSTGNDNLNYLTYISSGTSWSGDYFANNGWTHTWTEKPITYEPVQQILAQPTWASIKLNEPLKEGIEMKNLYEVFLVYGEDRKNPIISATERVIANDDEDARVKSGIYSKVQKEWDADYLTIIVRDLGAVKIKEKAKEVKNV